MTKKYTIALVAHDARKADLIEWVRHNINLLRIHKLVCTGTTGRLVTELFEEFGYNTEIIRLKSGPLGGDQEIGAMIANGEIDFLYFLADNLSMQPHDVDVKALSRLAQLYNITLACNRTTADHIVTSPLFGSVSYERADPDFSNYINREV